MTDLQCSMVSKELTTVFWIVEMWVHSSTCVYMCMISIVYFTGYIFSYYSHCSNLCCWSFGEATKLWLWIKCVLLAFIWYVLVCIGSLMIVFVGSRVHEWTRKEDTSVACTDGLKSTQSMSSTFGLSLKNDTVLGNDLNLHLRGSFTAGFIRELEVCFQEMEGFLWRELGVYVLKFWKILCVFWSFV